MKIQRHVINCSRIVAFASIFFDKLYNAVTDCSLYSICFFTKQVIRYLDTVYIFSLQNIEQLEWLFLIRYSTKCFLTSSVIVFCLFWRCPCFNHYTKLLSSFWQFWGLYIFVIVACGFQKKSLKTRELRKRKPNYQICYSLETIETTSAYFCFIDLC